MQLRRLGILVGIGGALLAVFSALATSSDTQSIPDLHFSPQGQPPYDVQFDRGPSSGPNPWNMTAPDGVIDIPNDILGVILQHGHSCQ